MQQAEAMAQRATKRFDNYLGLECIGTLGAISMLGALQETPGKVKSAGNTYKRVFEVRKKIEGLEDETDCALMRSLAMIYSSRGKLEECEEMFQQAVVEFRDALGGDHSRTRDAKKSLGVVQRMLRKLGSNEEERRL